MDDLKMNRSTIHIRIKTLTKHLFHISIFIFLFGCQDDGLPGSENLSDDNETTDSLETDFYVLPLLEEPVHYPGIALYTADMAKNRSTEANAEWVIRHSPFADVSSEIIRNGYNTMHKISFKQIKNENDYLELVIAIHGKLTNRIPVPQPFLENLKGIQFRAVSYETPINLTVEAFDLSGALLQSEDFLVKSDDMRSYKMNINNQELHHISFKISGSKQDLTTFNTGALGIDDVYIVNDDVEPFEPPLEDSDLLDWLKKSNIRFFIWNYRETGNETGYVLETSDQPKKVSVSGIGFAYAAFILAEQMLGPDIAKERILKLLRWQASQNWNNGTQGVFGFPYHYYDTNGMGLYSNSPEAVSTIDWAICAAGLRVVRQKYAANDEIVDRCNELLNRPDWKQAIHDKSNDPYRFGRIAKGLSKSGEKNGQVWGDAFSEETDLVYLEALASGQCEELDLNKLFREKKNGFYVSWFGSGFTYNLMQLWTGITEPYRSNSIAAFSSDAATSTNIFGQSLIGLTACGTFSDIQSDGFIIWDKYIGNQGASISGASLSEVIQISPAPYGASLALPFLYSEAMESLRNYINLGYYHPLIGLPDNIRIKDLPDPLEVPVPNWNPYDINAGPLILAIEQVQQNAISQYYRSDEAISESLHKLIESF